MSGTTVQQATKHMIVATVELEKDIASRTQTNPHKVLLQCVQISEVPCLPVFPSTLRDTLSLSC